MVFLPQTIASKIMKKYSLIPIFFVLASQVFADSYTGQLATSTFRSGRNHTVSFNYKIDISNKENINGTLYVSGASTTCSGEYEVSNGSIKNNLVLLKTNKLDREGCHAPIFKGEIDGNNFVGQISWRGNQNDIVLTKD